MLPVTPTHALAIARTQEVQRRAERAYLSSARDTAPSRVSSALRTLSRHLRQGSVIPSRPARAGSTALCCA